MPSSGAELVGARFGVDSDLEVTAQLRQMALDEAEPERGGRWLIAHDLPKLVTADAHERALESDQSRLIVGTIDDAVVGHGLVQISPAADAHLAMIVELFVHPEARGVGVGAAILSEIRVWASAAGCAAIESHVLPGNRAAKNFFERVGMVTRKMQVSTQLD